VLSERRLYHAAPSDFNDPFDCRQLVSLRPGDGINDEAWKKLLAYFGRMICEMPGCQHMNPDDVAKGAFESGLHRNETFVKQVELQVRELGRQVRVCCFSRSAHNVMMWWHYANKHQGVVFQFKTRHMVDTAMGTYKGQAVSYKNGALSVEDLVKVLELGMDKRSPEELGRMSFATKGREWRGEEEVRFFCASDREYLRISEQALSGIILGDKVSNEFVLQIKRAVSGWKTPPRLYKASIDDSVSKLYIRRWQWPDDSSNDDVGRV